MKNLIIVLVVFLFANEIKSLRIEEFFPFGASAGDVTLFKNDDSFAGPIRISVAFPFFSKVYTSLFVNTNGLISFERGVSQYTPSEFPLLDIIGVSPFWGDIDTRRGGDVFYREILDTNSLNSIAYEIRRSFSSFYSFKPTWAYCVTWYQVANFASGNVNYNQSSPINNTFQAIVATNGLYSFTIYNYEKLMWPDISKNITKLVQAGFNAGDGSTFYKINGSFTYDIVNIANRSNVGLNGKWIFRIDKSNIMQGGCSSGGYLTVIPNTVLFIGGGNITLRGPCFNFNDTVQVIYDNITSIDCQLVDSSSCTCQVPFLDRVGQIRMVMKVNNNSTYTGYINSKDEPLTYAFNELDPFYTLNQTNTTLNVTVDSKYTNPNSTYEVYLAIINQVTRKTTFRLIKNNLTDGYFLLDLNLFSNLAQRNLIDNLGQKVRIGYISLKNNIEEIVQRIGIIVEEDSNQECTTWHDSQPDPQPYLDSLPPCRPQIDSSFPSSFLNFETDKSCNPNNLRFCKTFHNGAKGCYRSTTTGLKDSRQQCCYNSNGMLLVGQPGGGTLDLFSSFLKHQTNDVLPYFYCCKFSNNCDKYYNKRPSDNGDRWRPPRPSGGSGDPHFLTLDQLSYTFNGYGEYIMLVIESINFTVQVRLQPYQQNMSKATVFKGIAIRGNGIDKIQIELDQTNSINFYINDLINEFSEANFTLSLSGLSVIGSQSGYILKYSNGIEINVELVSTRDALSFITIVPEDYKNKVKGLLGTYDNKIANDFTLPNGTVLNIDPNNDRDIFFKFGKHWKNTFASTIFTYQDGFSYQSYYNDSYVPLFISDGISSSNSSLYQLANMTCGNNKLCLFDVLTTGQASIGLSTIKFEQRIKSLNEEFKAVLTNASNGFQVNGFNFALTGLLIFNFLVFFGI